MSELTAQDEDDPMSDFALWLDLQYSRHGEIEDKGCAELLRALKAENAGMQAEIHSLKAENDRLAAALREARETFSIIARHPIKHDPQAYAVVRGIAETAIDDADAALSAVPMEKGHE